MAEFESPEYALKFVDTFILKCPDYKQFRLDEIVHSANLEEMQKRLLTNYSTGLQTLLINKLKYIAVHPQNNLMFELTDLGREVKHAGGHTAYIASLSSEKSAEKERQKLNDKKLKIDVTNAERIYKTYWLTFSLSVLALLISLVLLFLKLKESGFFR